MTITEADIIEERRVPERGEVAELLATYFVSTGADVATRLHAAIVALAADPARLKAEKSSFRANSRRYFGQSWMENLSRDRSLPRMRDLVPWLAITQPGYPPPKLHCPVEVVGTWQHAGTSWAFEANGTAAIGEPALSNTKRWCVHRQGDDGPVGDALWLYDQVDNMRPLFIHTVAPMLRVTLITPGTVYELVKR